MRVWSLGTYQVLAFLASVSQRNMMSRTGHLPDASFVFDLDGECATRQGRSSHPDLCKVSSADVFAVGVDVFHGRIISRSRSRSRKKKKKLFFFFYVDVQPLRNMLHG